LSEQVNYYKVLGVAHNASADAIQEAYYRRAYDLHPDRHPNAGPVENKVRTDAMARLNEARDTLGDARRRRDYDDRLNGHLPQKLPSSGPSKRTGNGPAPQPAFGAPKQWARRDGANPIWGAAVGVLILGWLMFLIMRVFLNATFLVRLLWTGATIAGVVMAVSVWWVMREMSR
ncbi:MAG TPA: J domain-containing protein, partial [Actinomycetota bacterium]|nr:J domain-containing protein [Actinomycetota bacterium]